MKLSMCAPSASVPGSFVEQRFMRVDQTRQTLPKPLHIGMVEQFGKGLEAPHIAREHIPEFRRPTAAPVGPGLAMKVHQPIRQSCYETVVEVTPFGLEVESGIEIGRASCRERVCQDV